MTLFEKKRYLIKLIKEWFPKTPIYFDEYLENNFAGFTQFNYDRSVEYFAFAENELIKMGDKEDMKQLALHEIAHGLNGMTEDDGHDDRWLKLFYAIGGTNCWCSLWHGWYCKNE